MVNIEKLTNELLNWIKLWFNENGENCNAIIGISSGKDSTIVAALCAKALGKNRVIGVSMPDKNQNSIKAKEICDYLGIKFICVDISNICKALIDSVNKNMIDLSNKSLQNIPPRIRMATLYAIAQTFNGRVVGTTNLDEKLTGYFTKYGDGLACDVEPIEMFTVNELLEIGDFLKLPYEWVHKVPSADLPNTNTDEEELGFSYKDCGNYIRGIDLPSQEVINKIKERIDKNAFKLKGISHFDPKLFLNI